MDANFNCVCLGEGHIKLFKLLRTGILEIEIQYFSFISEKLPDLTVLSQILDTLTITNFYKVVDFNEFIAVVDRKFCDRDFRNFHKKSFKY